MELRQLRYFMVTAEDLSISRAARRLRLAQPALSQQIKHLESELGVKLLRRNSRGVQLTEAGARLLEHARTIIQQVAVLPALVQGPDQKPSGEVRIGLPGTVSEKLAVPLIMNCRQLFPGIQIKIAEAMSGYIRDWLTSGSIDLAILYSTSDASADGIAMQEIMTEEVCLFATPALMRKFGGDGFNFSDLAALDLILPGRTHGLRQLIDSSSAKTNIFPAPVIEIDSYGQIKELVAHSLGFGILPRMAIQREVADGVFSAKRFTNPALERKIFLAWSEKRAASSAVSAVGKLARETLGKLVLSGAWDARLTSTGAGPDIC